jgi:16S rRNA (cytidine1402-2'-O)-methyltransferase
LRAADLVAAEDTRRVAKLLARLGIRKPTTSFHSYSSPERLRTLLSVLEEGRTVALVSDAGTPAISDPGAELVAGAWEKGVRIIPIPGPCAAIVALSAAGFPSGRFTFAGYPPRRRGERRQFLQEVLAAPWPVVIYEAPGRVAALLQDIAAVGGPQRPVLVARELTKVHEELVRGPAAEVAALLRATKMRGEVTIVVAGAEQPTKPTAVAAEALAEWLAQAGLPPAKMAAALVRFCSLPRSVAYQLARDARAAETKPR